VKRAIHWEGAARGLEGRHFFRRARTFGGASDPQTARRVDRFMPHASNIVHCDGPDSPHALDVIALKPRNGMLDARCPVCRGYGEWNVEIDLVSFRSKRVICDRCHGAGWVETGEDPVGFPDIELSSTGHAQWITRYVPREDVAESDVSDGNRLTP
jgi:hypothetical protein